MFRDLRRRTKQFNLTSHIAVSGPPSHCFSQKHTETLLDLFSNCLRLICSCFPTHVNTWDDFFFAIFFFFFFFPRHPRGSSKLVYLQDKEALGSQQAIGNATGDKSKRIRQPCCVFLAIHFVFTPEKLHFCFDLIKAKYWAIVRHLAGYAWHCNYLLRCFCLKGCIHAWNQF